MDKFEYRIKLDEMNKFVDAKDYDGAMKIADSIDWRRVRNIRTLCTVSEIYEVNDRLEDSKEILLLAYSRSQIGRAILYRLVELCIKMKDYDDAVDYYTEFVQTSPSDNNKYILKYKIYRGRGSAIEDQIKILQDYKSREHTEKWSYELAKLYHEAGMEEKCVEECEDLILWFNEGKYVYKAMELKMNYAPLTPDQKLIYEQRHDKAEDTVVMEDSLRREMEAKKKEKAAMAAVEKNHEEEFQETEDGNWEQNLAEKLIQEAEKEIAQAVTEEAEKEPEPVRTNPIKVPKAPLETRPIVEEKSESEPSEADLEEISKGLAANVTEAVISNAVTESVPLKGVDPEELQEKLAQSMRDILTSLGANRNEGGEILEQPISNIKSEPAIQIESVSDLEEEPEEEIAAEVPEVETAEEIPEEIEVQKEEISEEPVVQKEIEVPEEKIEEPVSAQEEEMVESQITGQLSIEDIMAAIGGQAELADVPVEEVEVEPVEEATDFGLDDELASFALKPEEIESLEQKLEEQARKLEEEEKASAQEVLAEAPVVEEPVIEEVAEEPEPEVLEEPEIIEEILPEVEAAAEESVIEEEPAIEEADTQIVPEKEELPVINLEAALESQLVKSLVDEPEEEAQADIPEEPETVIPVEEVEELLQEELSAVAEEKIPEPEIIETEIPEKIEEPETAESNAPYISEMEEMLNSFIETSGKSESDDFSEISAMLEQALGGGSSKTEEPAEVLAAAAAEPEADEFLDEFEEEEEEPAAADKELDAYAQLEQALASFVKKEVEQKTEEPDEKSEEIELIEEPVEIEPVKEDLVEAAAPEPVAEPEPEVIPEVVEEKVETESVSWDTQIIPPVTKEDLQENVTKEIPRIKEEDLEPFDEPFDEEEMEETIFVSNQSDKDKAEAESIELEKIVDEKLAQEEEPVIKTKLTEDEKGIFSYFAPIQGMEEQLATALSVARMKRRDDKTSKCGNLVILGNHGTGKTALAINMIKAIKYSQNVKTIEIARADASDLNNKDMAHEIGTMKEHALLIERAGLLSPKTIMDMSQAMEFRTNGLTIVLEDEKQRLRTMLEDYPDFARKFDARINIPIFTNDELVSFGKSYARELGCRIDDLAILALYNLIGDSQSEEHPITVGDVKDMVDRAIKKADRFGIRKFFKIMLNTHFDEDDRIVLYERDFM